MRQLGARGQELGTRNAIFCLTTIHGLDHDLMQLRKTSDRKMVMYNIASNLNGT